MGLQYFEIELAENKLLYHAGERVKGKVCMTLSATMEIKTLNLKIIGKAKAAWSGGTTESREVYSEKQILFEENQILFGEGESISELPKGQHTYAFDFQLPSVLPSSFTGQYGSIKYRLNATIDKTWKDHTSKDFIVFDTLDLNTIPNMLRTSGCSRSKQMCCWLCTSGLIEVECQVERTGYTPAEYVTFSAAATNSSRSDIEKTSVQVVQIATYRAKGHKKEVKKPVNQVFGPGVSPHDTMLWVDGKIMIPALPPSDSEHCNVIHISYSIQIQVHLRTCAFNLKAECPIVLGTIPLRRRQPFSDAPPEYPGEQQAAAHVKLPLQNSETPPPSYAEVTGERVEIPDNEIDWDSWGLTPEFFASYFGRGSSTDIS